MSGELCLLLGGLGFMGSHVADALLAEGYAVRLFDLPRRTLVNAKHLTDRVEIFEGDFTNTHDLERALKDVDYVCHLVWTTLPHTSNDNPIYDAESNLIGTLRLLQLLRTRTIKRLIFVSSGGTVYGVAKGLPIPETHPTEPKCAYGITKLAVEQYLNLCHHLWKLDYVVLRVSNPYGERQRSVGAQQGVVSVFIDRLRRGEAITIWGDGSSVRDFIYVKDVAEVFTFALSHELMHRVFNVGSGTGTSLNTLLGLLARVTGITPDVRYEPSRIVDVPSNVLDTQRLRNELGWSARTPLDIGVARTWAWMRQQAR